MSEREEIVEKLNLYALAVDTRRWDLFDRIFAHHVDADYGSSAHWHDLASFQADFGAFHAVFDATQHMMANHQVVIDGDRAHSLTYGSWRLVRKAAPGDPLWDGTGWYDDEWARTHAGWRILKRVCRVVWFTGNDTVRQTEPDVAFTDERKSLYEEAKAARIGFLDAIS